MKTHTICCTAHTSLFYKHRFAVRSTSLSAEWAPKEGAKWEEKDYEGQLKKLEKEAEDRLDKKISEMMGKIEATGSK